MNMSAKETAQAYVAAKTAAKRKEILTYAKAKADASGKARWKAVVRDIESKDSTRLNARATGDWTEVNAQRAEAEPKAPAKSKPAPRKRAPAKPKASPATQGNPLDALAQMLASDDAAMVAFFDKVASLKAK